jgi:hypothetical protein
VDFWCSHSSNGHFFFESDLAGEAPSQRHQPAPHFLPQRQHRALRHFPPIFGSDVPGRNPSILSTCCWKVQAPPTLQARSLASTARRASFVVYTVLVRILKLIYCVSAHMDAAIFREIIPNHIFSSNFHGRSRSGRLYTVYMCMHRYWVIVFHDFRRVC